MKKKKTHGIQLLLRVIVRDPNGKVISDTGQKPAKSFVIQFLEFIYGCGLGAGGLYATATDGTEDYIYWYATVCSLHSQIKAGVNNSGYGIVIGTGDTAETNSDYKLEAQLTEGVGAGNITHGAMVVGTAAEVGANVDMEIKREFSNLTGSAITVKEAGMYTVLNSFTHCIVRDTLGAGDEVPDKCSLTIIYTMRTTV